MAPAFGKRRAFGQHFLKSEIVVAKILDRFFEELQRSPCRRVLEIGPGHGALTHPLLERLGTSGTGVAEVLLVERDRVLGAFWSERSSSSAIPVEVKTQTADFAELPVEEWSGSGHTAILSNLPYSASTSILAALTQAQLSAGKDGIPFMVLMFQAEVADRIHAPVGSRECSALTLMAQNAWETHSLMRIPPGAFSPPPEVDSEVLVFRKRAEPMIPDTIQEPRMKIWERLVRTCFLHRRKMLRSSLKGDPKLRAALDAAGVDGTRRPEALLWEDWKALMSRLTQLFGVISTATAFLLGAFLSGLNAQANVGDAYGFGSRSSSLAGASVADGTDGFAAYANPALLGLPDGRRFVLTIETLWMTADFTPIQGIVTENTLISNQVTTNQSIDTSYNDTVGEAVGATFRVAPEFYNLSLGFVTYLPLGRTMYLDSGESFLPEYVLYRSRTQRPQLETGLGANISPWLSAGLGGHLAFSLTNEAEMFLQSSPDKSSSMRVKSSLKPKLAPYFGLLLAPPTEHKLPPWSVGLVVRLPVSSPAYFDVSSGAQALFGVSPIDFNLTAVGIMQYDPLSVELGGTFATSDRLRTFLQAEFQGWAGYEPPAITINGCQSAPCGLQIADSQNPQRSMRNIVIPKIGEEFKLNDTTSLRAGYSFRPSIFRGPSGGEDNYLDPPKHVFGLGAGFRFRTFLGKDIPSRLDLHASYQMLVTQSVSKLDPTAIGAPGYSAGGKIYGGGISLSMEL